MKIAVIGSGGREHAILWRLSRDVEMHSLFALPGNGGTIDCAETVNANSDDLSALREAIHGLSPDLVVVGPEIPLAAGIADRMSEDRIPCFGPYAAAARIEASKVFAKQLMHKENIPTADWDVFDDFFSLEKYVKAQPEENGWVVKADGLAAGKGAFVCNSLPEVLQYGHNLLVEHKLGPAGSQVVLERKLSGREVSALYWCSGERFLALPAAQDYKRALDGDHGQNTGGMGSYCPAVHLTSDQRTFVETRVVSPILRALREQGSPYRGILYVGLMLTADGPQVIEFNCRFGDPETQVILPVWKGDFGKTLFACASGDPIPRADDSTTSASAAVCVVLAAEGYPDAYPKGIPLQSFPSSKSAVVFHAGTTRAGDRLISAGGRVFNAVGFGNTITQARENAYDLAMKLNSPGLRYRSDIAQGVG